MSELTLSTYKSLLRSLVRSAKHNKIQQLQQDTKKQIALLTYNRIQLVRQQQEKGLDAMARSKVLKQLSAVGKKIEILKTKDPLKSKELLFYSHSKHLKDIVLSLKDDPRSLQHLKDIAAFVVNQSEYEQLIERYNPGLKMSQEEKVQKTANKVGLQVPE
ncbi:Fmc1p [Kluyveromyces lactis]|uniref:KLLA0F04081p n=1 Tax=Kluyveromyces lactis (strain ATCC 8585 / CBS 2359 / DSM 70799 / NBRC 1267 / NRRL Y-1140 / WM37) TaxID=284590 RepID=Q6CLC4_KLULA|nr:uncharacterized protein KLLA0_F04081g [Kluyveromyces lactis]CAG97973.1 KLLA0F04081p [Kluyveromyces lactis]|eukprot:XP_455265.1 uncharacterized protein KLLA0_F04081g [Kluyveromyces lactis]